MPDKLLVEVVPLCDCPCLSRDDDLTPDGERCQSAACNGHGHPVCGECRCCGDYRGPNCQCLRRAGGGGGGEDGVRGSFFWYPTLYLCGVLLHFTAAKAAAAALLPLLLKMELSLSS